MISRAPNTVKFFGRRSTWILLTALVALTIAGLVTAGGGFPEPDPEDSGGAWSSITYLASTTPNSCHTIGQRCAEWCTRFQGGTFEGSGILCCVDEGDLGLGDLSACNGFR